MAFPPVLRRTADRKVAFGLRATSAGRFVPIVANSHGLPAIVSCPGRTAVCAGATADLPIPTLEAMAARAELAHGPGWQTTWRHILPGYGLDPHVACYAVEAARRGTEESAVKQNMRLVRAHLADADALTAILVATLEQFRAEAVEHAVAPYYRFHWDGDIPTEAMAVATARALTAVPDVHAWLYTRSLFAVPHLITVSNLTCYVSVDSGNVEQVRELLTAHPDVRLAALGERGPDAAALLASLGRNPAPVCPVDSGKLPVVTAATAARAPKPGEKAVGACALCQLCVHGRADVRFTLKKAPRVLNQPADAGAELPEPVGKSLMFGKRPGPALMFEQLVASLRDGAQIGLTWKRTYVTVRQDDVILARVQARGKRLLVVLPTQVAARQGRAVRDISGQRHQCPGRTELTLTDPGQVAAAVRLVHAAAAAEFVEQAG